MDVHIYNNAHLGDQLFTLYALNKAVQYLDQTNINVIFHLPSEYIAQVQEFVQTPRIILLPFEESGLNCWICNTQFTNCLLKHCQYQYRYQTVAFNKFLNKHQNEMFSKLNWPIIF